MMQLIKVAQHTCPKLYILSVNEDEHLHDIKQIFLPWLVLTPFFRFA